MWKGGYGLQRIGYGLWRLLFTDLSKTILNSLSSIIVYIKSQKENLTSYPTPPLNAALIQPSRTCSQPPSSPSVSIQPLHSPWSVFRSSYSAHLQLVSTPQQPVSAHQQPIPIPPHAARIQPLPYPTCIFRPSTAQFQPLVYYS